MEKLLVSSVTWASQGSFPDTQDMISLLVKTMDHITKAFQHEVTTGLPQSCETKSNLLFDPALCIPQALHNQLTSASLFFTRAFSTSSITFWDSSTFPSAPSCSTLANSFPISSFNSWTLSALKNKERLNTGNTFNYGEQSELLLSYDMQNWKDRIKRNTQRELLQLKVKQKMPLCKKQRKRLSYQVCVKFQRRILFRRLEVIHTVAYTSLEKLEFVQPFLLAFAYMWRKIIGFFFIQKRSREKDIDFVYFIDEVWIKKCN